MRNKRPCKVVGVGFRTYPLNFWSRTEYVKRRVLQATSAAAAMVYIIRAATQFSARDVIIAAAAGNAGAVGCV